MPLVAEIEVAVAVAPSCPYASLCLVVQAIPRHAAVLHGGGKQAPQMYACMSMVVRRSRCTAETHDHARTKPCTPSTQNG